jgi:hypothetical protein
MVPILGDVRTERLIERVNELETLDDIGELGPLLSG